MKFFILQLSTFIEAIRGKLMKLHSMGLIKFLRRIFRRGRMVADRVAAADVAVCKESSDGRLRLSWNEIQRLTMDFSFIIGYGGFTIVYLAQLSATASAAVKVYHNSQRLYEAYEQELQILLRLHHHHIVKLLGHCHDQEVLQGVLILEYISNGNLKEKLQGSTNVLPWKRRMAIAFQLGQAIAYLHEKCSPQIVHGDIKSSNILLDENLNCKLCDFGSAKMGHSSAVIPPDSNWRKQKMTMMGSPGYTDPLYLRTGLASKQNDVYSFGVVLLELITGLKAFSRENGDRLTAMAAPVLRDARRVAEMVDPRLLGEIDMAEAIVMAAVSAECLSDCPGARPCASDILTTITNSVPSLSLSMKQDN